jgi:plastocyanin
MRAKGVLMRTAGGTAAILLVALVAFAPGAAATPLFSTNSAPSLAPSSVTIDITATTGISFAPSSFTVSPGESVTVVVTQAANFDHTFTLSSVANFTIPSTDSPSQLAAFFNAHPPLVNLSLGSTAGSQHTATFTAPSTPGTYEFLCLIHFPQMTGVMTDSSSSASSGGGGGGLSTNEIVAIGAGAGIVVVAAAVLAVRRSRRPPK